MKYTTLVTPSATKIALIIFYLRKGYSKEEVFNMLDIKIGDINPNGWEFTLHLAADQYDTYYEAVNELLYSI